MTRFRICTDIAAALFAAQVLAQDQQEVQTIPVRVAEEQEPEQKPTPAKDVIQLDTIEVTANKRLKSQRDIPGSVNAIRGEELERINAQGMADYLKRIPGVTLPEDESDAKVPIIRGIATSTGSGFTSLPAGIYADDMPFADVSFPLVIPDINPFDLERVEVLKGPQGTLYGAGALAGLIRYVLNKPKPGLWEGKLLVTAYANTASESLASVTGAALNIPLFGDRLAIRAVGLYRKEPGVYDEVDRPGSNPDLSTIDYNSLKQTSGRLLASWQTTDRLKLSAFFFQQNTYRADDGAADNRENFTRDPEPFASPRKTSFSGANISANYNFDWGDLLWSSNRITKSLRQFSNYSSQAPASRRIHKIINRKIQRRRTTPPTSAGRTRTWRTSSPRIIWLTCVATPMNCA